MAKDFLSSQIRTNQIIASRSLGSRPSLIFTSASAADGVGGLSPLPPSDPNVFVFFSGSRSSDALVLFGGSIKTSGSLTINDNATLGGNAFITGTLYGSPLRVSGSIALSGSLRLQTQDSPPTVGANESMLYVLDDGGTKKLYWKNSDNVQQQVGTGGGGGGSSYFTDPSAGFLNTTGSLSLAGGLGSSHITSNVGSDVFLFVSGTRNDNTTTAKKTVFNGDIRASGSLAQGLSVSATGNYSHAEGWSNTASGNYSHAEGVSTVASGIYSHAEGNDTDATGEGSHAEGDRSLASGTYTHAEGLLTTAAGDYSHAEGSQTTAAASYSHAAGLSTIASGSYSYAGGQGTISSGSYQHVIGRYNKRGDSSSLFVVGNGLGDDDVNRSDVFRILSGTLNNGKVEVTGSLSVSGNTNVATNLIVAGNATIDGNLTVQGTTTTIDTNQLVIEDPLIYFASGSISSNQNGGIAIASGSSVTDQALVWGRVANDTWGAGRKDVSAGTISDLTSMVLLPVRASKLEVGGTTAFISSSDGSKITAQAGTDLFLNAAANLGANSDIVFQTGGTTYLQISGSGANNVDIKAAGGIATASLLNTTSTTVNAFGAATSLTIGATAATTTTIRGGTLVGNTAVQNIFNGTATTVNFAGAGTDINIGSNAAGSLYLKNSNTNISGSLVVAGTTNINGAITLGDTTGDNITFAGRVNSNILPSADLSSDLGGPSLRWRNIYTGDLHLRNDRGDYTLIEEEDFLSIRFNKTGKRYKFVLEPVPELDEK